MNEQRQIIVFGEVLFDCFPKGEKVLGGAPFNVAWHVQALGDHPLFVSRVGDDVLGQHIRDAMGTWGMDVSALQADPEHATGHVKIEMADGEPRYTITSGVAYDFIDPEALPVMGGEYILYHGSLAMRNGVSRAAFEKLAEGEHAGIFLDINLREPWWRKEEVCAWLQRSRWAKMNEHEMRELGFTWPDMQENMRDLQSAFCMEHLIVTRGKDGVLVRTHDGEFHDMAGRELERRVDPVGAGDAFSAVYLHGLMVGWSLPKTLEKARDFAEQIIGIRGATPSDRAFYSGFL